MGAHQSEFIYNFCHLTLVLREKDRGGNGRLLSDPRELGRPRFFQKSYVSIFRDNWASIASE